MSLAAACAGCAPGCSSSPTGADRPAGYAPATATCHSSTNPNPAARHAPGDEGPQTRLKRPSPLRPRPTGSAFVTTVALRLNPPSHADQPNPQVAYFSTGVDGLVFDRP